MQLKGSITVAPSETLTFMVGDLHLELLYETAAATAEENLSPSENQIKVGAMKGKGTQRSLQQGYSAVCNKTCSEVCNSYRCG